MQFCRSNRNLMCSYRGSNLCILISYYCLSVRRILLDIFTCPLAGTNICTACCRVDCPVYGQRTVDIYLGIQQIRIFAIICFAGSIPHCNKLTVASIVVRNPLVTVIDIDAAAVGNSHFSALRDIRLHARQQSRRLVDGQLAAGGQIDGHVVGQRQNIATGTDTHTCQL